MILFLTHTHVLKRIKTKKLNKKERNICTHASLYVLIKPTLTQC